MLVREVEPRARAVEQVAAEIAMSHLSSSTIQREARVDEVTKVVVCACLPQTPATIGTVL
ncbi:hypothetical protein [Pleomorphomonas sp. JP5]|uniref:hypothetical protein n=1 Tax=Pleomorphomonas sp. JP5 TaxID=2942998 RepID=UPI00204315FD|nr:hypothetical protein [Pleomorphomonas sp. JP5]MCM5558175.1 hypothetical protein [Pleomorphomonas sp. JP5]